MFTERFIRVHIRIYSVSRAEVMGKEEYEDSWFKFLPSQLESYRPTHRDADGDPVLHVTQIQLKSGDTCLIDLSPKDFEKLLNTHQND